MSSTRLTLYQLYRRCASKEEYAEYEKHKFGIPEFVESFGELIKSDFKVPDGFYKRMEIGTNLRETFEKRALNFIVSGKMVAFGYEMPRRAKSEPVRIPDDVFTDWHNIDWGNNTVKGSDLHFTKVYAVKSHELGQETNSEIIIEHEEPIRETPNKVGRPNLGEKFVRAFKELEAEGCIDLSAPKSAMFAPVIQRAIESNPEEADRIKNVKDSTLYKSIGSLFSK